MSKRKKTAKRKKPFPFRKGQRVTFKDEKKAERLGEGVVWSGGPACIGSKRTCKIPGGPLIFEDMVFVTWVINGKERLCWEEIDVLKAVKVTRPV